MTAHINFHSGHSRSIQPQVLLRHGTVNSKPMDQKVRVAAVQAEPVWNDLEGGVQKVISIIEEAATNGAQVLGFPEVFIPGYPWYVVPQFKA